MPPRHTYDARKLKTLQEESDFVLVPKLCLATQILKAPLRHSQRQEQRCQRRTKVSAKNKGVKRRTKVSGTVCIQIAMKMILKDSTHLYAPLYAPSNVLLSAIGWKGKLFQCLERAHAGTIEVFTCPEILDELTEKLESRLAQSSDFITQTLADLLGVLRVVSIPGELQAIVADPDDDQVLECAVVAHATHIVSGDRKHLLPLGSFRGIRIVSQAEFRRLMDQVEDQ